MLWSKCILLTANTTIFAVAVSALGAAIYVYSGIFHSAITTISLLTLVAGLAVVMVVFSLLGCRVASSMPRRKCSRLAYLMLLVVMLLSQLVAAVWFFNLRSILQTAEAHDIHIGSNLDTAARDTLQYLHDQVGFLYEEGNCTGGGANGTSLPISFASVECEEASVQRAFTVLELQSGIIVDDAQLARYSECTAAHVAVSGSSTAPAATQLYCSSEANVVVLMRRYSLIVASVFTCLALLTVLLLVSTVRLMDPCARCRSARCEPLRTARARQDALESPV